ncbi:hypothetical protein, partial [Rhizobium laguerreae]|uniref:hypothetical protein n=1 Tax=Rhizobium laguerreae TaxID=1076926 RepID=UPI0021B115D7
MDIISDIVPLLCDEARKRVAQFDGMESIHSFRIDALYYEGTHQVAIAQHQRDIVNSAQIGQAADQHFA